MALNGRQRSRVRVTGPSLALAIAASVPWSGARAATEVDAAQQAYAAGQYDRARELWTPRAKAGDEQAQLGLAMLYDLGQGGPRNAAAAYRWYHRAAAAGVPQAEFNVAVMRDTGDGIPHDAAAAALWYARAAAHGNGRAQYNLAQLYLAGEGVPRDMDVAEAWLRDAAPDLPAAADRLAAMRRDRAPPAPSTALAPAQLIAPANGSSVPGLAGAHGSEVELVWTSGGNGPARFFVQLLALDASGATPGHEQFAKFVDETATLAPVDPAPGQYAWRVYSISRDTRSYAASPWARFQVTAN